MVVILAASLEGEHRSAHAWSRSAGYVGIHVCKRRSCEDWPWAFCFDLNLLLVIEDGTGDPSLSLERSVRREDKLSGFDILRVKLQLLDN